MTRQTYILINALIYVVGGIAGTALFLAFCHCLFEMN